MWVRKMKYSVEEKGTKVIVRGLKTLILRRLLNADSVLDGMKKRMGAIQELLTIES